MLVLRLLLMVLTILCLMNGHEEVSSSTIGIRDKGESLAVKTNEPVMERKKAKPKCKKYNKKKCMAKCKLCSNHNDCKKCCSKWCKVTTTPLMTTSTLKMTTFLTTLETTTIETTIPTPTTTSITTDTTTSTASVTEATTPKVSSITTTPTKTMTTTAITTSPPTTPATTADSGAGGECKATNGKQCIFPFKDGKTEYNECKNHGGNYFWCATSVYDSGKYKHWSYCPKDGTCPLEGDGECRATNNKPCVFPFKDGKKEYKECADHGGEYFWCATGTNSAGKYTAWSICPKDGSCPLPQKSTPPGMTPTSATAITTPLTTGTSMAPEEIENKVFSSLTDLVKEESKDGTLEMIETMNKITQTIIEDMNGQNGDSDPKNIESNHTFEGGNPLSQEISLLYKQGIDFGETRDIHQYFEYDQNSVEWIGSYTPVLDPSDCCSKCRSRPTMSNTEIFDYFHSTKQCYCYKKKSTTEPKRKINYSFSAGECGNSVSCDGKRTCFNCNSGVSNPNCPICCSGQGPTAAGTKFHTMVTTPGYRNFLNRGYQSFLVQELRLGRLPIGKFHALLVAEYTFITQAVRNFMRASARAKEMKLFDLARALENRQESMVSSLGGEVGAMYFNNYMAQPIPDFSRVARYDEYLRTTQRIADDEHPSLTLVAYIPCSHMWNLYAIFIREGGRIYPGSPLFKLVAEAMGNKKTVAQVSATLAEFANTHVPDAEMGKATDIVQTVAELDVTLIESVTKSTQSFPPNSGGNSDDDY